MAESIRSYRFLMDSLLRVALPVKGRRGNKCLTVTCGCGGASLTVTRCSLIFVGKGLPTYS